VRQFYLRIRRAALDLVAVLPRFLVKMQQILAESPTQPAHAEVHPQTQPLPQGQFVVERFGDELRDLSATEHG
jgi:hypothetical protein